MILHSPKQYHYFWDSHYTDAAWAEGDLWIAVDYIASSRDRDLRGIYGTFIDTRYFDDVFKGLTLDQIGAPLTGKAVGYWTFDGLDNDFVRDSAHSHYGDIHGAQRVLGRYGTSLDFDGDDHYVMIYDEATLWAQSHFALEVWINTRDAAREQTILSKGKKYRLLLRDGRPVLEVGFGRAIAELAQPLVSNRWYHLVVIYGRRFDYTRVTFFVDGKEVSNMRPAAMGDSPYPGDFTSAMNQSDTKTTEPINTRVCFVVLDAQGDVLKDHLEPGADLSGIDAEMIMLRAELLTSDYGQSPILHEWSLHTTEGVPAVITWPVPFAAALPVAKKRVAGLKVDRHAVRIQPVESGRVVRAEVPVGTSKSMIFQLEHEPGDIAKAWLKVVVEDIDEAKEATIILNGTHKIEIHESLLGEGAGYDGALIVPVEVLAKGRNTFEFTFADNLGGETAGYTIMEATLAVTPKSSPDPNLPKQETKLPQLPL